MAAVAEQVTGDPTTMVVQEKKYREPSGLPQEATNPCWSTSVAVVRVPEAETVARVTPMVETQVIATTPAEAEALVPYVWVRIPLPVVAVPLPR